MIMIIINNIFRVVDKSVLLIFSVLSGKFTSLQSAIDSTDNVSVPDLFNRSSVLIGRMILSKDSTTPVTQTINNNPWGIA